ncbi:hypothetical protein BOX15_Mlig009474g1, partial [Macrostomum lignano]
ELTVMSAEDLDKEPFCQCADASTPDDPDVEGADCGASSEEGGLDDSCPAVPMATSASQVDTGDIDDMAMVNLLPNRRSVMFRLSLGSGSGGGNKSFLQSSLQTHASDSRQQKLPSVSPTLQESPPQSPSCLDNPVFVESAASLPQLLLPPPPEPGAAQSLPRRLEISSPTVRLLETRKEGPARVAVLKLSASSSSAPKLKPGRLKSYRLVLTGPDLLLYRGSGGTIDRRRPPPEVILSLARTTWLAVPGSDRTLHLRCHEPGPDDDAGSKQQQKQFEFHIQWETPELRRAWIAALTLAKDLLINRQFTERPQQPQPQAVQPAKHTIVQRLNDFFRRRPAIDELERRGIVRSEPVFGASLTDVCARDGADTPLFLRRCIAALEARGGLETVGLYRIGGNAATVQRLRLLVDQTADYDLNQACWDINVLASALKTFLRELKQPLLAPDLFQAIARHHMSGAKPSMRRAAVWQELQVAPGLPTLRLVFGHLSRVVHHSAVNQMSARNLALVIGPNLLWPAGSASVAAKAANLATDLALQTGVVEYLILEADYLFDLSRVEA